MHSERVIYALLMWPPIFFGVIPTYGILPYAMIVTHKLGIYKYVSEVVCGVGKGGGHQHQLVHQCSLRKNLCTHISMHLNIMDMWEWNIIFYGLNDWNIYDLMGGRFMS